MANITSEVSLWSPILLPVAKMACTPKMLLSHSALSTQLAISHSCITSTSQFLLGKDFIKYGLLMNQAKPSVRRPRQRVGVYLFYLCFSVERPRPENLPPRSLSSCSTTQTGCSRLTRNFLPTWSSSLDGVCRGCAYTSIRRWIFSRITICEA